MKLVIPFTTYNMRAVFLALGLLCVCGLIGQSYQRMDIALNGNGKNYKNPWVGGLVAPQFNAIDFNSDGLDDILVFDRLGNVALPFINEWQGGVPNYRFAPEYKNMFPEMEHWVRIRDFNKDGLPDIFTYPVGTGIPGIEVHKGKMENGQLTFEKLTSSLGQFDIIYFEIGNSVTQVYVSTIDIPEIQDLDGDGDLDIIAFDPSGGQVSYYKNLAVEKDLSLDSLVYELADVCYGKFIESGFSEDVLLSNDGERCGSSLKQEVVEVRHAGSTITAFDENGDGLIDIFLGDLTYNGLVRLTNGGTQDETWFTSSEPGFPSYDVPVDIQIYNSAFHLDYDNDGRKDLIVAPNEDNAIQTTDHVWYYKNRGTEEEPNFDLEEQGVFVDQMLHLGLESRPAIADINEDGLLDIVVGTSGHREDGTLQSRLYLLELENNGITIVDDDFLGFSQFVGTSNNLAPAFGDLDNDGDEDLIVGDDKGAFYFVENKSVPFGRREFDTPIYNYQDLKIGTHAKPALADINQDGLLDLVVGERNFNRVDEAIGSLNYIENTGTPEDPKFEEITTEVFGEVSTQDPRFINNYSSPTFYQNGEELLLFNGSANGRIYLYDNISGEPGAVFNLLDDDLGGIREGIRTQPAVADLNQDGLLDIIVGNRRGGLAIYTTDIPNLRVNTIQVPLDAFEIEVNPNPVSDFVEVKVESSEVYQLRLFDVTGKELLSQDFNSIATLDLSRFVAGIYVLEVTDGSNSTLKKLVKI